jgi:hypothetical protein
MFTVVNLTEATNFFFVKHGHSLVQNGHIVLQQTNNNTMDTLRPVLSSYLEVNKQLTDINSRASELRDRRRLLELDLSAAYAEAQRKEPLPDKIELKASHMVFQVKKPGDWKKGWTLSKKQLHDYLLEILPEHGEDVMREIVKRHEPKLTATEYSFELKPVE